ncbi:hypothetical protein OC845_006377, partial [Tilletia horrida]
MPARKPAPKPPTAAERTAQRQSNLNGAASANAEAMSVAEMTGKFEDNKARIDELLEKNTQSVRQEEGHVQLPWSAEEAEGPGKIVTYSSKFVNKLSEVTDEMSISGSLSIKYAGIGGSGSGSFFDAEKFYDSDLKYLVSVNVINQTVNYKDALVFNPLRSCMREQQKFNDTFGDSFISGFLEGGTFNALVLTGMLAALARCPYRSLEGWLTPTRQRQGSKAGQQVEDDEQQLQEQFRSLGSFLNWSPTWITSSISGKTSADISEANQGACPIIVHVLLGLAAQVRRYARSIPDFSRYLRERREGLIEPSTPTPTAARTRSGGGKGTAAVPLSKVPLAFTLAANVKNEDDDQTGLPPVLYWKTTPPEDAARPVTTALSSSKSKSNGSGAGRGKNAASARLKGVLKRAYDDT